MYNYLFYLVIYFLSLGVFIYDESKEWYVAVIAILMALKFSYDEFIPPKIKFANNKFLAKQKTITKLRKIAETDNIDIPKSLNHKGKVIDRILDVQRDRRRPLKFRMFTVGTILVVICASILNYFFYEKTIKETIAQPRTQDKTEGTLCALYSAKKDSYIIHLGGNSSIISSKSKLKTMPLNVYKKIHLASGCSPILIELEDQKIVVTGIFRDYTGSFTAQLEKNKWKRNSDNRFMLNRDECAIEIVDDKLVPVLRIEYVAKDEIRVSGIIYCEENSVVVLNPDGGIIIDRYDDLNSKEFHEFYLGLSEKLPKLFTYVGEGWFGKRAK